MALSHSPKIVTDGLVFYYDMANTKKSWKGAPITNILQPANDATNIYHPSYRPYSGVNHGTAVISTEVQPPIPNKLVYRVNEDGVDTQNARYSLRFNASTLLTYGKSYTLSYYIYLPSQYAGRYQNLTFDVFQNSTGTDWHSVRGFDSTSNYYGAGSIRNSSVTLDVNKVEQWQRVSVTFTPLTENINLPVNNGLDNNIWVAGYIRVNVSGAVNGGTPYHLYISSAQLEELQIATDFVDTSRTNTQAILDLVGGNTVTASSLTYNSDGTFSFDGTSNVITVSGQAASFFTDFTSQQISLSTWIKVPTAATWTNGFFGNILSRGSYAGSIGLWRTTTNNQVAAYFRQSGATFAAVQSSGTIQRDVWVNLTASWTGSILSLYINGSLAQSNTGALGTPTVANWTLGSVTAASGANGNRFQGDIGVTQIYNRALSATEVLQNFNALRGRYGV